MQNTASPTTGSTCPPKLDECYPNGDDGGFSLITPEPNGDDDGEQGMNRLAKLITAENREDPATPRC